AGYVPGLILINNGGAPGQASLALRGIAPPSGTGAAVATYIDETPFGTSGLYGRGSSEVLDLLPYDFQSMEVLRGPQGTLYGANAFGGVVRYVSKQPDLNATSFRVGADTFAQSGANDLGVGAQASFSLPLIADRLALSVSVAQQNSPGFTDNVRSGEKDQDSFWQRAAHATLLWKANDDLSVKFSVFDARSNADSSQFTALDPVTLKPTYGDLKNDNHVPESYKASDRYYNGTLNWDLGFADFVSSTSYAQMDHRTVIDASDVYGVIFPALGLPDVGVSAVDYRIKLHKTTQEFRLVSKPDDHLEWLLGAFWTRESARQDQVASAQFLDLTPIPGLDPLELVAMPSTYKEYAGFGDLTYKFTSAFDISAGVRWARNSQTFTPTVGGALGGVNYEAEDSSENVFTYSLSPRLHFGTDSMLYLRIASGYAPGGPNIVPAIAGVDIPA
ncbi:MAG: TonB-dependent receptor, partial [Lysobacter sp.]|nr:TonB-dependent receptor [Lysobacter sp.]